MAVRRIVANVAGDPRKAAAFYRDVLGLAVVMDLGWIVTFAAETSGAPQLSVLSEGGSGTEVPYISVEVDDLEDVFARVNAAAIPIVHGPTTEPWGVRRFYVRDPFGRLVNILTHD